MHHQESMSVAAAGTRGDAPSSDQLLYNHTWCSIPHSKHGEHGGAGYTGRLFRRRSHVQFSIQLYTY